MHDAGVGAEELEWVREVAAARGVEVVGTLPGATTSSLLLVKAHHDAGAATLLVLRRYDRPQVLEDTPDIARREAVAIHEARSRALGPSAPSLVGVRVHAPVPLVLMSYVRGEVMLPHDVAAHRLDRWLHRLAAPVANTHATLPLPLGLPAWRPWLEEASYEVPPWTHTAEVWRRVVAIARLEPPREAGDAVFVHGDWHPGNCLWEREEVLGVVDWAWASIGPAAADVAHCRTNLALLDSPALADRFLDAYRRQCPGHRHHPWYDAADLLSMAGDIENVLALNAFGAGLTRARLLASADRYAAHLVAGLGPRTERSGSGARTIE